MRNQTPADSFINRLRPDQREDLNRMNDWERERWITEKDNADPYNWYPDKRDFVESLRNKSR